MANKIKFGSVDLQKFFQAKNPNMVYSDSGILTFNTGIFGSDTDNGMPQFLIDLKSYSSVHANMLNLKSNLIKGNSLTIENENAPNSDQLDLFMKKRNKAGDNLFDIYDKASTDISQFEAAVLQVIYSRDGNVSDIYHVPVEKFRLAEANNYGQIEFGYISEYWADISNKKYKKKNAKNSAVKLKLFDPFNFKGGGEGVDNNGVQLLYIKKYTPGMYYAVPNYISAIPWILIDYEISQYHLNNIRENYFMSGLLTQQGSPSDEEIDDYINNFESMYKGGGKLSSNTKKLLFAWVDDMTSGKPEFTPFQSDKGDNTFQTLMDKAESSIIAGHNGYEGLIFSDSGADLGGDANKLYTQIQTFNELVTTPLKKLLVDGINKIIEINKLPKLTVITEPPKVKQPETQVDDLTQDERRKIVYGLPPIQVNNTTPNNEV